jgi:hypothetical protein
VHVFDLAIFDILGHTSLPFAALAYIQQLHGLAELHPLRLGQAAIVSSRFAGHLVDFFYVNIVSNFTIIPSTFVRFHREYS